MSKAPEHPEHWQQIDTNDLKRIAGDPDAIRNFCREKLRTATWAENGPDMFTIVDIPPNHMPVPDLGPEESERAATFFAAFPKDRKVLDPKDLAAGFRDALAELHLNEEHYLPVHIRQYDGVAVTVPREFYKQKIAKNPEE